MRIIAFAPQGDTVKATLIHEQVLYPNVEIVSNFLAYKNGLVNGFNDKWPVIHMFNKNETILEGTDYYDMVHNRQNIILMGWD